MGGSADWIHKSLLPLNGRAVLSQILSTFNPGTEFVFAINHKADQIRDFMAVAHPEIKVTYVTVENITGPNSGPGYSLWSCREHLPGPFFIVCGDTLVDQIPQTKQNWLGIPRAHVPPGEKWCNLRVVEGKVVAVADKVQVTGSGWHPFTGLARIQDRDKYFRTLESALQLPLAGEVQISHGFPGILNDLHAESLDWRDTGTADSYLNLQGSLSPSRLSKRGELVFFEGDRVLRFFADADIASKRSKRAEIFGDLVPQVTAHKGSFFAYTYVPGRTLAATTDAKIWRKVFNEIQNKLWQPAQISAAAFESACRNFYVDKTLERQNKLFSAQPELKFAAAPLGLSELNSLFKEFSQHSAPARVHGDLQPENILTGEDGRIHFIDWRQDFGGLAVAGDKMWDLAKFNLFMNLTSHPMHPTFKTFLKSLNVDEPTLNRLSALALVQMGGIHLGQTAENYYLTGLTWLRTGHLQVQNETRAA